MKEEINLMIKILLEMGDYSQYELNFKLKDMLNELEKINEKLVRYTIKHKLTAGAVYFSENITDNCKDTFSDSRGEVPNTNPVILNHEGNAYIYMKKGEVYKILYFDDYGALIDVVNGFKAE